MANGIFDLTLVELAGRIAGGQLSPVEVTRACLERIDDLDDRFEAFISVYPDLALDAARRAEDEIRSDGVRGPLHGIPVGFKDLVEVDGMTRTCGSRVYPAELCNRDATVVAGLRGAGAIPIGMTRLNEFAYGPTGINAVAGSPRNPWDLSRACGGSSSGSGCAVAARLVWGALGTDTGGSIRLPASLCGVAGHKPTFGALSREGVYPLAISFDTPGPLARTIGDCRVLFEAMRGRDDRDSSTWSMPAGRNPGADGLADRPIGVLRSQLMDELHPETLSVFETALKRLAANGYRFEDIRLDGLEGAMAGWTTMSQAEAFSVHRERLEAMGEQMSPDVARRLEAGRPITAEDYLNARAAVEAFKPIVAEALRTFAGFVLPTTPVPAISIETGCISIDGRQVEGLAILGRLTRLANITGQPAVSVPCGLTSDGLPVGLQLIGDWFADGALLDRAEDIERTIGLPGPPTELAGGG